MTELSVHKGDFCGLYEIHSQQFMPVLVAHTEPTVEICFLHP
jgi:hypothetical protein